jgi:hypothetical protein
MFDDATKQLIKSSFISGIFIGIALKVLKKLKIFA